MIECFDFKDWAIDHSHFLANVIEKHDDFACCYKCMFKDNGCTQNSYNGNECKYYTTKWIELFRDGSYDICFKDWAIKNKDFLSVSIIDHQDFIICQECRLKDFGCSSGDKFMDKEICKKAIELWIEWYIEY